MTHKLHKGTKRKMLYWTSLPLRYNITKDKHHYNNRQCGVIPSIWYALGLDGVAGCGDISLEIFRVIGPQPEASQVKICTSVKTAMKHETYLYLCVIVTIDRTCFMFKPLCIPSPLRSDNTVSQIRQLSLLEIPRIYNHSIMNSCIFSLPSIKQRVS